MTARTPEEEHAAIEAERAGTVVNNVATTYTVAPAPVALLAKLVEVAAEVGAFAKDGRNDHHHYDYVTAEAVVDRVGAMLAARNVLLVPAATNARHEGTLTTVDLLYRFLDADTGESLDVPFVGVGFDKGGDKGLYKAYTGALKYLLRGVFMIPWGGDDPEADRTTSPAAPERPAIATIPASRAERLAERCQAGGVKGAPLKAYLGLLGVDRISALNVDQAEEFEAWVDGEVAAKAQADAPSARDEAEAANS